MPTRTRPAFPKEWHVPQIPSRWVTWARADRKLKTEKTYWVATSRPDGRPHSVPVWGIWRGERFYFETAPGSVKGRNLKANPRLVVHLQDGWDTVIVEGVAEREDDPNTLETLARAYRRKYHYRPDWSDPKSQILLRVTPKIVHAWKNPRMHRTQVKFSF